MGNLPPALAEWEALLAQGAEVALTALLADSERSRRLRQSSPFVGVLTPEERNHILLQYEQSAA